ncbi:hypothetical protein [Paraburkholderia sp.]|uniref:hypothetical protein n=1 Tax=Paraburkholderia sp. TaxID=1926495 RepID=UPI003C7AC2A9
MGDTKVPKTKEELRSALAAASFLQGKLTVEQRDAFIETVRYRDGGLGHMDYGPIKAALDAADFEKFLNLLGITDQMFARFKGSFCDGSTCQPGGDNYCDPAHCHP